jgi:hypothetical protein
MGKLSFSFPQFLLGQMQMNSGKSPRSCIARPTVLARYTASRPDAPYQFIAAPGVRCVRLFLGAES